MTPDDLRALFVAAVAGHFPPPDGRTDLVEGPVGRAHAVVSFSAHFVVCAPVERSWLDDRLVPGSYTTTHSPRFLRALADRLDADIGALDVVLAADGPADPAPSSMIDRVSDKAADRRQGIHGGDDLELWRVDDSDHPRVRRARRYRHDVEVWRTSDRAGHLVLGRGLAGRREASFEVAPTARGRGLGVALARAARRSASPEDPVFVQVSPGNVASLRAALAAGHRPIGSEVLLAPVSTEPSGSVQFDVDGEARDLALTDGVVTASVTAGLERSDRACARRRPVGHDRNARRRAGPGGQHRER